MGFYSNFYHSWRGDTPGEPGFGTDIRFARAILDVLDQANEQGLEARITAFEVNWKKSSDRSWLSHLAEGERVRIKELNDGESYDFRIRSVGTKGHNDRSENQTVTPGAVEGLGITQGVRGLTFGLMLETFYYGLIHALTSP